MSWLDTCGGPLTPRDQRRLVEFADDGPETAFRHFFFLCGSWLSGEEVSELEPGQLGFSYNRK